MDPRSLANLLLDIADREHVAVTNLSLNKIAYFVHGNYLAQRGKSLVDAKIEAWQYGPVFREIYHQFKDCGDKAIKKRAKALNALSGEYEVCAHNVNDITYAEIKAIAVPYLRMRASYLVNLSHIDDGPWHKAWFHDGEVNPGMEITNSSIQSYFKDQVRH